MDTAMSSEIDGMWWDPSETEKDEDSRKHKTHS